MYNKSLYYYFFIYFVTTTSSFANSDAQNHILSQIDSTKELVYGGWGASYYFVPNNNSYKWYGFAKDSIPVSLTLHHISFTTYFIGTGIRKDFCPKWFYMSPGIGFSFGSGSKNNLNLYNYPASTYMSVKHGEVSLGFGGKTILKNTYFMALELQGSLAFGKTYFRINCRKNVNYEFNESIGEYEVILNGKLGYKLSEKLILCLGGGYHSKTYSGPQTYNSLSNQERCNLELQGWVIGIELLSLKEFSLLLLLK